MKNKIFGDFNTSKTLRIEVPEGAMKRQLFSGENVMVVKNVVEAHSKVPSHQHPHEQILYIVSGECDITVGEGDDTQVKRCGAGEIVLFPGDVEHGINCVGDEDLVVFDIFSPIREEWIKDFE